MKAVERRLFPKSERLCLQKDIDRLFASGDTFVSYPLRIVYRSASIDDASKILVSVPKKRIKSAVMRNRIKRLIRESYRLNRNVSTEQGKQKENQLHIAFLYLSNDIKTYDDIEKAMRKALDTILQKVKP